MRSQAVLDTVVVCVRRQVVYRNGRRGSVWAAECLDDGCLDAGFLGTHKTAARAATAARSHLEARHRGCPTRIIGA
jgi:hypothetical protein